MMPARTVKPYVKRNKNDAADAEAICEAVRRPSMRLVPIKTPEQQAVLMEHRSRQLFVRQGTQLINSLRAHLGEFGFLAGIGRNGVEIGRNGVERLVKMLDNGHDDRVPLPARDCLLALRDQLASVKQQILEVERASLPVIARAKSAGVLMRSRVLAH
jgi:transposase